MSARIISANISDLATLSSSDFAATLPVTNLQVEGRGRVARTTNATGNKVINGNFAAVSITSACVLYNHNLTSQATIRLQLWDADNQTGNLVYDTGTFVALPPLGWGDFQWGLVPWGANVFTGWGRSFTDIWFPAVGAKSFRITLADAINPDGYLQVKRLLIGPYFEPAVNMEYGMNLSWQDNSDQVRTQGGSLRTDNRVLYRKLTGKLPAILSAERATWMNILRTIGKRSETFFSIYPEVGGALERDHAVLGKFTDMPDLLTDTPSSYSSTITFEEV